MKKYLAILALTFAVLSVPSQARALVLFQDDFEAGLSNWNHSFLVSTTNLITSPAGGQYAFLTGSVLNRNPYMYTSVSTLGYDDLAVSFYANTSFMNSNDYLEVGYSLDGSTWERLTLPQNGWTHYDFELPEEAYNQNNLFLGFQLRSHGGLFNVDFAKLDQFIVSGHSLKTNVVPEPASMMLFGSGMAGLLGLRKKRS